MPVIYLVRHAEPVSHYEFDGGDSERPLSTHGEGQARWMGEFLRDKEVTTLKTAPHTRCRQTAELIGEAVGLEPVVDDSLHISRSFDVPAISGTQVWVAHSNNIPGAVRHMGVACWKCGHASAWRLELDGKGEVVSHDYIEPEAP